MTDISDAYESAYTIMLNLNRLWIQKQGDFFVESPIILLAVHHLVSKDLRRRQVLHLSPTPLSSSIAPMRRYFPSSPPMMSWRTTSLPFMDAWEGGAQDQLQGQIASAKIPLSRMISPALYWVMTGDDFSLDINNPREPKVLVVGNNPDRQNIYSAALGLYNSRIVKLINKKKQLKSSVIIDELPTIYFRGFGQPPLPLPEVTKWQFVWASKTSRNSLVTMATRKVRLSKTLWEMSFRGRW